MNRVSEAETVILKIIWEKGVVTSKEIVEELKNKKWHKSTIGTLIKRLVKKGTIKVIDKKGKSFLYTSAVDEGYFKYLATKKILNDLFKNNIKELLNNYEIYENKL